MMRDKIQQQLDRNLMIRGTEFSMQTTKECGHSKKKSLDF